MRFLYSNSSKTMLLNKILRKSVALAATLLLTVSELFAQSDIEMADRLREDGKIWVVVGVIVLIFLGLAFYLIRLDSKISAIEKKIK